MSEEIFWQMFTDTGDPLGWLLKRAAEKNRDNAEAAE